MKLNSSRCDEKLRGSVKPFLFKISLKDVVNAGERSNLLIFLGGIYVHEPGSAHSNNGLSIKRFTIILEEMRNSRDD